MTPRELGESDFSGEIDNIVARLETDESPRFHADFVVDVPSPPSYKVKPRRKRHRQLPIEASVRNTQRQFLEALDVAWNTKGDQGYTFETAYDHYLKLPDSRVCWLSEPQLNKFLSLFSRGLLKTRRAMVAYLSVLEDMKENGTDITVEDWNSAIAFVGRHRRIVTANEMRGAVSVWQDMELNYKIKADTVTFNTLIDIAFRARLWNTLTELVEEMGKRELPFDRFTYVMLIIHRGIMGDASGVHQIFADMQKAGEVVDTVTLNAVITSLLRVGDLHAADGIFEGMKRRGLLRDCKPPQTKYGQRVLARNLKRKAGQESTQEKTDDRDVPIAPDLTTFAIFISHHCCSGNFNKVYEYLIQLADFKISATPQIYTHLFTAFANYGHWKHTKWNHEKLMGVYRVMMSQTEPRIPMQRKLVLMAIRAFGAVGTEETLVAAWREMHQRWLDEAPREPLEKGVDEFPAMEVRRAWEEVKSREQQLDRGLLWFPRQYDPCQN
ncbi:hypothetical protein SAICODRAFT_25380 [Saitoella complicata NRRL Y-17804]|nr:uncharacterized protein SAICODRAFT_25380 [Saitoella complicata NRRL Y-17804]ODQ52842.1 hypothetical protein SAICODRAFT_25380 [Saitoella complicata NRRL Y-17804]